MMSSDESFKYRTRWERRTLLATGITSGIGLVYTGYIIFLAPLIVSIAGYGIYKVGEYRDKRITKM